MYGGWQTLWYFPWICAVLVFIQCHACPAFSQLLILPVPFTVVGFTEKKECCRATRQMEGGMEGGQDMIYQIQLLRNRGCWVRQEGVSGRKEGCRRKGSRFVVISGFLFATADAADAGPCGQLVGIYIHKYVINHIHMPSKYVVVFAEQERKRRIPSGSVGGGMAYLLPLIPRSIGSQLPPIKSNRLVGFLGISASADCWRNAKGDQTNKNNKEKRTIEQIQEMSNFLVCSTKEELRRAGKWSRNGPLTDCCWVLKI